jgi:hypothetical protein
MQNKFQADVEKTFRAAARHRDVVTRIKKHAQENPDALAIKIVEVVPERLKWARVVGLEEFGIDLADAEAVKSYEAGSVAEWQMVSWLATYYQIYSAFWREAKAWAEKLAEADSKRSRYQDMAAEGLITFEELGEKLLVLEETRETAERELETLKSKRDRIMEMEQDRDALLDSLMQVGSEALDTLTPDEKHQLYRILRLEVVVREDRTPEVSGAFGEDFGVCLSKSQCRTALK